jgi:glycosyltransferase involved in cell wall biosynthesis
VPGINPYGLVVKSREFRHQVRAIPFDIIHTHAPFVLGRFAEEMIRYRKIPMVATFHTLYKDDFYGATHSKTMTEHLVRMILKHFETADEVWTPTEWSKRKLYEYGFEGEVIVMPNGCDMVLPSEQQHAAYRSAGRAALKLDKDIPVCLYVGQLKKEKNIGLTIEALGLARAKKFDFHMVFVGTGSDRPYFERMLEERNLAKSSTFTGRISDREQLKTMFAASDLFLFPSQYDTSALVMQEAAAFGVPLVNTAGSATAFMTNDGVNGFVTDNKSEAFAERLMALMGDMDTVKKAGAEARKTIYRHWSTVIDEVEERYLRMHARNTYL